MRKSIILVLSIVLLFGTAIPAMATSSEIAPRYKTKAIVVNGDLYCQCEYNNPNTLEYYNFGLINDYGYQLDDGLYYIFWTGDVNRGMGEIELICQCAEASEVVAYD